MSTVYYQPEAFDLTIVGEIDFNEEAYQFDFRIFWQDQAGKIYTARDSGCSCPTPFEDYHGVNDLAQVELCDINALRNEVADDIRPGSGDSLGGAMETLRSIESLLSPTLGSWIFTP